MMTLQVIPDLFSSLAEKEKAKYDTLTPPGRGQTGIRRPVRGTQLKEETFATIRLVASGSDGRVIKLFDAGGNEGNKDHQVSSSYSNFLLQSIQEDRMEKQQILETFGEPYIFLFGERARMMTFQGVLLNTEDFNWEAEWWTNYDTYLRGTKAVESSARVFIFYDETLVSGYILSTSSMKNAQERNHVPFSFQLFVTSWATISSVGDSNADRKPQSKVKGKKEASTFMPKTISGVGPLTNIKLGANGLPVTDDSFLSLADAMINNGVKYVNQAFTTVANLVKWGPNLLDINNRLNGTVVRVPIGFAGMLEYDDPFVQAPPYDFTGPIKFGVYSDNTDEYISAGSQYLSSVGPNGANRVQFEESRDTRLSRDKTLVDRATKIWADAGLYPSKEGPATAKLLAGAIGLLPIGPATSWVVDKGSAAGNTVTDKVSRTRTSMGLPVGTPSLIGRFMSEFTGE